MKVRVTVGQRRPSRFWLVPRVATLLVVLIVPLIFAPGRGEVFAPVKIEALHVLVGVGLIGSAVAMALGGPPSPRFQPVVDLPLVAFAVLNVLAWLHSRDRAVSLWGEFPEYQGLATVLAYLIAYAVARMSVRDERHLALLFAALTAVTGLLGAYAMLQRLGLDPLWGFAPRPFATLGHANNLGAMLVVGLPAVASTVVHRRHTVRVAAVIAGVLGLLGLVVSQSRGAWLAAVIAGTLGLLLLERRHRRHAVLIAGGLALTVAGVLILTPAGRGLATHITERIEAVTRTGTGSTAKHLALIKVGLAVTADHPWLGVGQDIFPQVAQPYANTHLSAHEAALLRPYRNESPHNAMLSISSAAGIPALIAYLAVIGAAVSRILTARRRGRLLAVPVLTIVTGYLVSSLFMTAEVSSTAAFWVVLGASCSVFSASGRSTTEPVVG